MLKCPPALALLSITCIWSPVSEAQTQPSAKAGVAATVWIEPRIASDDRSGLSPRQIQKIDVVVDRFDDQALVYHIASSTAQTSNAQISIAENRVVWLAPRELDDATAKAISALYERKSEIDIASLLKELKQPRPAWFSQWIGMHLWQATFLGEKTAATLELVNQLDAQPMPSLMIGGLPIRWSNEKQSAIALSAANDNLNDKREATKLTAASWLLGSADDEEARNVLQRLVGSSKRKPIVALADLLLQIRLDSAASKQLPPQSLRALDRLPITLSAGPTQRLAHWYRQNGRRDRAIEMTLQSILITPRPNPLSSLPVESDELWKELTTESQAER